MKLFRFPLFCLGLLSIMFSCASKANNSKEITVDSVLTASGPLFEGSNTFQSEIDSIFTDFLKQNDIKKEDIVDVKLISASASLDAYDNLNLLESINLQIFSDNFPMQNIAFANNISENLNEVEFKVADIQEKIKSILFDDKSYMIADGTLKEDVEDDLSLKIQLKYRINYYKK